MKKLIVIIITALLTFLVGTMVCNAQEEVIVIDENGDAGIWRGTSFYVTDSKLEIRRIQHRFDAAVIGRDYFVDDGFYFMELEEDDVDEYFELLHIRFYCIPRRKAYKVTQIMLWDDSGVWYSDKEFKI